MTIQAARTISINGDLEAARASVEAALTAAGLTLTEHEAGPDVNAKGGNLFAYRMLGLLTHKEEKLPISVDVQLEAEGATTEATITVSERQGAGVNTHLMDGEFEKACAGTLDHITAALA